MSSKLGKIIFYLPAILLAVSFGSLVIGSEKFTASAVIIVWLALFFISGLLLNMGYFMGSILGILPGIHMIYMGTQDTGQIINETPIGIIISVFYVVSGYIVYRNNLKIKSNS